MATRKYDTNNRVTLSQLEKQVALTTGRTYKDSKEIIDRFWELLEKEVFDNGKRAVIRGYGSFYLVKNKAVSKTFTADKRKSKNKKSRYALRFSTSKSTRNRLRDVYGNREYDNLGGGEVAPNPLANTYLKVLVFF